MQLQLLGWDELGEQRLQFDVGEVEVLLPLRLGPGKNYGPLAT